jgi:uncharacterized membrane protein YjgN (DUF898 family)
MAQAGSGGGGNQRDGGDAGAGQRPKEQEYQATEVMTEVPEFVREAAAKAEREAAEKAAREAAGAAAGGAAGAAPRGGQRAAGNVKGAPQQAPGQGGARFHFTGEGGELFKEYLIGLLLTGVTLGIYLPWFICSVQRWVINNTSLQPSPRGVLQLNFKGQGGDLFGKLIIGLLLTGITCGIYYPWFAVSMQKYFTENTEAVAKDGTRYQVHLNLTGGQLFFVLFVGGLLTGLTAGIYVPWFLCNLQKAFLSNMTISENGQPLGKLDFTGEGGKLFGTYLVGLLLTLVTCGIYSFWLQVDMNRFFAGATRVDIKGRTFAGRFEGTGLELLKIELLGMLLIGITCGLYMPWYIAKVIRWRTNALLFQQLPNPTAQAAGTGAPAAAAPAAQARRAG